MRGRAPLSTVLGTPSSVRAKRAASSERLDGVSHPVLHAGSKDVRSSCNGWASTASTTTGFLAIDESAASRLLFVRSRPSTLRSLRECRRGCRLRVSKFRRRRVFPCTTVLEDPTVLFSIAISSSSRDRHSMVTKTSFAAYNYENEKC